MCVETPNSDGLGVDYACGTEQVCAGLPMMYCDMNDYCVFDYTTRTCVDCPGKCPIGVEKYECCGNNGGVCETVLDQYGMETEYNGCVEPTGSQFHNYTYINTGSQFRLFQFHNYTLKSISSYSRSSFIRIKCMIFSIITEYNSGNFCHKSDNNSSTVRDMIVR